MNCLNESSFDQRLFFLRLLFIAFLPFVLVFLALVIKQIVDKFIPWNTNDAFSISSTSLLSRHGKKMDAQ